MIITVTLNPAIDQTIEVDHLEVGDANRVASIRWDIGGKGINVARVLKELHYEPLATGFAPGDLGRMIEDELTGAGIGCDFTFVPGETRTNITIVDRAAHVHTALNAAGPRIKREDELRLLRKLSRRLRRGSWLVVAGSIPPPGDPGIYVEMIHAAQDQGALTALDADGPVVREVLRHAPPTLVKINDHELERLVEQPVQTEDAAVEAALELHRRGVEYVVVTRGAEGAIAVTPRAAWRVRAPHIEVRSAVGAGDGFLAGLLLGLQRGEGWERALMLATAAGAAVCLTAGTRLCREADVESLIAATAVERLPERSAVR